MKKLHLCLISTLLAASMHAQSIDYTKGLSIWFDKPNNLDGRASWYAPTADKSWESNSLPIGNGSLGGNILGSVAAEDKHWLKGIKKKQKSLPAAISTDWQITNPAAKLRSVSVLTPVWEKHTLKQD